MLAFLCGGMEFAPNGGRDWREQMRGWLTENLHHRVFDPTEEAHRILSAEELKGLRTWKTTNIDRYRQLMRFIIRHDLNVMANQTDYVVCYWDEGAARGGGSHSELTMAHHQGIPVYLVTEMPVDEISGWVLGCADKIFADFGQLQSFLAATYGA